MRHKSISINRIVIFTAVILAVLILFAKNVYAENESGQNTNWILTDNTGSDNNDNNNNNNNSNNNNSNSNSNSNSKSIDISKYIGFADSYITPTANHGDTVLIVLPLVNYSGVCLESVIVTADTSNRVAEWPFLPETIGSTKTAANFGPYNPNASNNDQRQDVKFAFIVRDDVKTGCYPLKFTVSYYTNGTVGSTTLQTYINTIGRPECGVLEETEFVEEEVEEEKTDEDARIELVSYETVPEKIIAGDTFKVRFCLKNKSTNVSATNVSMKFLSYSGNSSNVFIPSSGSEMIYIDKMGAGEEVEDEIELTVSAGAEEKIHDLDIELSYDTSLAVDNTKLLSMRIPIYQIMSAEMGKIDISPEIITPDSQGVLTGEVYNTGKAPLYNVRVSLFSSLASAEEVYVGNIAPGEAKEIEMLISAQNKSLVDEESIPVVYDSSKLIIKYENESGDKGASEKELNKLKVGEETIEEDSEVDTQSAPTKDNSLAIYIMIAIATILIVLIITKKR